MNMMKYLTEIAERAGLAAGGLQFPDCELDPGSIKVVMINEVVPRSPEDWFYSECVVRGDLGDIALRFRY